LKSRLFTLFVKVSRIQFLGASLVWSCGVAKTRLRTKSRLEFIGRPAVKQIFLAAIVVLFAVEKNVAQTVITDARTVRRAAACVSPAPDFNRAKLSMTASVPEIATKTLSRPESETSVARVEIVAPAFR